MTDKEDLLGSSTCEIENDAYDILNFEIMKALKEENEELKNKLDKYKRAFEILKDTVYKSFDFNIFCREVKKGDGVEKTYFIIFGEVLIKITKDEYELLEELMKDD